MTQPCLLKTIVVGNSGVGKTSLITRLCKDTFEATANTTIGVDYVEYDINIGKEKFRLVIWDTAGQERFFTIVKNYFRMSLGILVVFDITNRSSFEKVPYWLRAVRLEADSKAQVILIGNKSDAQAQREVAREEAERFAKESMIDYMETSALDNTNVKEAFVELTEKIHKLIISGEISPDVNFGKNINVQPTQQTYVENNDNQKEENEKSKCC